MKHGGLHDHDLCWIARKSIPKLEHGIGRNRFEVVITVDKAARPCLTMSKKGSSAENAA